MLFVSQYQMVKLANDDDQWNQYDFSHVISVKNLVTLAFNKLLLKLLEILHKVHNVQSRVMLQHGYKSQSNDLKC